MKSSPIEIASEVQRTGLIRDNEELEQKGISPVTEEAVPYYTAWTRTGVALASALLALIATDTRELVKYAKLITVLLAMIAIVLFLALSVVWLMTGLDSGPRFLND
jgi:uncharacterized protein YybS (DUF2232 family)